jgi:hypothetical protein
MMDKEELVKRVHRELADSYDEEMELELEDRTVDPVTGEFSSAHGARKRNTAACISANCSACRANWSSCRTGWCRPATRW